LEKGLKGRGEGIGIAHVVDRRFQKEKKKMVLGALTKGGQIKVERAPQEGVLGGNAPPKSTRWGINRHQTE